MRKASRKVIEQNLKDALLIYPDFRHIYKPPHYGYSFNGIEVLKDFGFIACFRNRNDIALSLGISRKALKYISTISYRIKLKAHIKNLEAKAWHCHCGSNSNTDISHLMHRYKTGIKKSNFKEIEEVYTWV